MLHDMRTRLSGSEPPDIEPDVKIAFILSPDFTLLPFAGFIDAVRHASDEADNSRQVYCKWACLSATREPVRSSCGIEVLPWSTFGDPSEYDYVVVVGGLLSSFSQHHPDVFRYIIDAKESGANIVGLCTGSFVIAETGLMSGRRCGVHAHHRQELVERHPDVIPETNEMYVFDGQFITCPGGTAAIDLAVDILCSHCGKARGMKGLTAMVVDEHRGAHEIGRHPFQDLEDCGDRNIERAVRMMRQNLGTPMEIGTLARSIGVTPKQLSRAFVKHANKTPLSLWREMRLQHARWRLLNTSRSVTEIAYECGFADSSHFSRWFVQEFGEPPQKYRIARVAPIRPG